MRVEDPGHVYDLDQIGRVPTMRLEFLKRSGDLIQHEDEHGGVICQEVMRVLIDRLKYLNDLIPCVETELALDHTRTALYEMECRAWRRKQQEVNRMDLTHDSFTKVPPWIVGLIESYAVGDDGHIDQSTW